MPNQKLKSENYNQLGGINSKVSQYQNSPLEFLDIKNFDFQTPGALTERWGSTQYTSQAFPGQITGLYEYAKLDGSSFIVIGSTGGLWYGATTGNSKGMSLTSFGSTASVNATWRPWWTWTLLSESTITNPNGVRLAFQDDPSFQFLQFSGSTPFAFNIDPQSFGASLFSLQTFVNYLFIANGSAFLKFDGITTTPVGLVPPITIATGATINNAAASSTVGMPLTPTLGTYCYYGSFVNSRGFESQIWPLAFLDTTLGVSTIGGSFVQMWADVFIPQVYGISSINVYSYFSASGVPNGAGASFPPWAPGYILEANYPASGTTMRVSLGTTVGNFTNLQSNVGPAPNLNSNTYFPFGFTLAVSTLGTSSSPINAVTEVDVVPYYPTMLEVYNNQLWAAGFSSTPSTLWFSDVGEPEGFQQSSNFEVRTNDGDVISCIRGYTTRLYIWKRSSFHALFGNDPTNYYLQDISFTFGCLNNNCAVLYEDMLVFLDRKGIIGYNGATAQTISTRIQPIFDRMNYSAAINVACMEHDKLRNQVIIAIPVDNSTVNNMTIIYDYVANAWTTYSGFTPTLFKRMQGRFNQKPIYYGSFSGTINAFGESLVGDNGVGFTSYFKTRFLHDMGDSIEKQWRRLYLNADAQSATYSFPINFYQDYGPSVILSATFKLGQFQNRYEFGIPAKSLAFELYNLSTTSRLRLYGFTLESRLQRMV